MKPLWSPSQSRIANSAMTKFENYFSDILQTEFTSYSDFHNHSIENSDHFWRAIITFFDLIYEGELEPVNTDSGFNHYGWFPKVRLNYAENLLSKGHPSDCALHYIHESGHQQKLSYAQLTTAVASLQGTLSQYVGEGDVVGCYMPNIPETVISMLATTALGGVFTSTSCDFGIQAVCDRFRQSKPKVLIAASAYQYNGKTYSLIDHLIEIEASLDSVVKIIVVDFLATGNSYQLAESNKFIAWTECQTAQTEIQFIRTDFHHPLYIMYSSGTTGTPKCIVHSSGGTLLQHVKEHGLHCDLNHTKSVLFFTTCGWMMWNWLVSGLAQGARICLYEGSPSFPTIRHYVELIDSAQITIFGTSPKFLKALQDNNYVSTSRMDSLETILSTGSPLLDSQFDYIYTHIKSDVCLASMSGGTDLLGCFMLGNPNLPVYRGEIQCLGLGMDVRAYDDQGEQVFNTEGELVCNQSFPSRPVCFLNDQHDQRLNAAYFSDFPGVWRHGDFIEITDRGTVIVYGRSDATLNPGGVRIGTAEIYRQVETLAWVNDSVCVARKTTDDVDIVMFVKLHHDERLQEQQVNEIKALIKTNCTVRHVPKYIWQVSDIPYTHSGKKMELVINRVLANKSIKNKESIANPECLTQYQKFSVINNVEQLY